MLSVWVGVSHSKKKILVEVQIHPTGSSRDQRLCLQCFHSSLFLIPIHTVTSRFLHPDEDHHETASPGGIPCPFPCPYSAAFIPLRVPIHYIRELGLCLELVLRHIPLHYLWVVIICCPDNAVTDMSNQISWVLNFGGALQVIRGCWSSMTMQFQYQRFRILGERRGR